CVRARHWAWCALSDPLRACEELGPAQGEPDFFARTSCAKRSFFACARLRLAASTSTGQALFHFDPTIRQLPVRRGSIAWLAESSNQPNVAVPGRQAQAAQAYAVALRARGGTLAGYVSLWLTAAREPVVYVHDEENLPESALERFTQAARDFCESMGFILDPVSLDDASDEDRARILARLRREGEVTAVPLGAEPPAAL